VEFSIHISPSNVLPIQTLVYQGNEQQK